ncbi:hypothetical protein, conserved [Trypanosoma brucei brucei TREU927]|uniref:Uncharacterized protein n=1 Tax=Trypanosoma brucei brucei (strain 927/4 GUTat10.1) TaxID=185431 RepID=Q584A0_TRYB2|nr:hypothetical protein, conserved [Trypanosoma brucei brucei TREU927]AAX79817.1 hypothetical protein, conserved [Trypanosoma brucei]AAZ10914.1 hypothetical protein, conserved [Trypanosoma brucei brucei TREU927]
MGNKKHMLSKLLFACFVYEGDNMISVGGVVIMFSFLVVACANSGPEGDEKGKGKALTQSDANAICSIVRKLRELRNNVTHNMKFGEKIVEDCEKIVAHYSARVQTKTILVDVLKEVIPEEDEILTEIIKLLSDMKVLKDELRNLVAQMHSSLGYMRLPSWNLLNMSDSYAYWIKDTVESFAHAALSTLSCCLVVDGGATGDCMKNGKRGSVPRDCIVEPLQRSEGSLAEYKNPLDEGLTLTMGNAGNYRNYSEYGCYITTTHQSYTSGRKSLIYELSGGLFYTQNNNVVANFSSIGEEFQELIDLLSASVIKISAGNTSITAQRAVLDRLLLELEERVRYILEKKETTNELTETLGIVKHIHWNDKESNESDSVARVQQTLLGVALLLLPFVFGNS